MSDGNFNRALLPHTPYQSGLLAGKRLCRMHAIEAFKDYLRTSRPDLDDNVVLEETERFRRFLSVRQN